MAVRDFVGGKRGKERYIKTHLSYFNIYKYLKNMKIFGKYKRFLPNHCR